MCTHEKHQLNSNLIGYHVVNGEKLSSTLFMRRILGFFSQTSTQLIDEQRQSIYYYLILFLWFYTEHKIHNVE